MPFRSSHSFPGAIVVLTCLALSLLLLALFTRPARGSWSTDSTVHLVVSSGGSASAHQAAPDGRGGTVVAWTRQIGSDYDVLAQRVLADGRLDPAWPAGGFVVATGAANQQAAAVVGDGAGGAHVVWIEWRDATRWDLLALHVLSSGVPDPAWPAGGVTVCAAVENQQYARGVEDGTGGAFLVWQDERPGTVAMDVYAHRLLASGLDPAWPANGLALSTAANRQDAPELVADGLGGMIAAWRDARTDGGDIYAQRVSAAGTVAWTASGLPVCTATGLQWPPCVASDGAGGALIAWADSRNSGATGQDVYAQHVRAAGSVDPAWPANGAVVVNRAGDQSTPRALSDGAGGAVLAWTDTYWGNSDVAAHHLLATGTRDPAWVAAHGAAYELCRAAGTQNAVQLVPDGSGGAIATWSDSRSGNTDVYAGRVPLAVPPAAGWPTYGLAVAVVAGTQSQPLPVAAPAGDAIVFWTDSNAPASIRAARVSAAFARRGSSLPAIVDVRDVPGDQGGRVHVLWEGCAGDAPGVGDVAAYRLWRRILVGGVQSWEWIAEVPARGVTGYALMVETAGDSTYGGVPWNVFVVRALRTDGTAEYASAPDSGYSVDDLSPTAPQQLAGEHAAGTTTLRWLANAEPDVAAYRVYGGDAADFLPAPANRLAEVAGTSFAGPGPPRHYAVSAVDARGNEGPFARLDPAQIAGAPQGAIAVALSQPRPNPLRESCAFALALPRAGPVSLAVYDAGGRRVRVLLGGHAEAGARAIAWDGRDARGEPVPNGLYFVRLRTAEALLVRRLAVLR